MNNFIYLDNGATTTTESSALEKSISFYEENFFNPSARYRGARKVAKTIDECRETLLTNLRMRKIIFTSCGSEADNIAILGFGKKGNVVTTLGEHSAVYNTFLKLKEQGVDVRFANLNEYGEVDLEDLKSKIDANTTFVSVVHVNNETGAINDINSIAKEVKALSPKCIFHSDGVQAFGKIPYTLNSSVDLYSVSGHKLGALKGVGALIIKDGLRVPTFICGGGQENGVRSGTENVLGIINFAEAYKLRLQNLMTDFEKMARLKDVLLNHLDQKYFKVISAKTASPYIVSISAVGLRGEVLQSMMEEDGVIIGTGSACSSKKPHSRILSAFEKRSAVLDGAIRISFSWKTTEEEVIFAANKLNFNAAKLSGVIK